MDLILPFKIGDFAEAKCFDEGFKGAWFRSKIKDMRVTESGHLEYYLEYIDYTEEANEWIGVFQKNPFNQACLEGKSNGSTEIMLRPSFPRWYRGQQAPKHFPKSEVIARVHDTWKVGDWVDWHNKDCYWTGQIIELTSKNVVEVKFLDHPMGEGQQCLAKKKDLRPALDWSIIKGWTVPLSATSYSVSIYGQAKGKSWQAAHLVHPKSNVEERSSTDEDEALGSSSTVKTHSSDRNIVSKLRNQRMATHESSDPSRRRTRSSCGLLISPSEPATVEPNGSGSRRYPFRVRRNAAEQQR
ncbi:uncharacterized protein LOC125542294 isoform X1 [Triticum urartu]|uniref:uncharacterized protein LOC125542293 isoform X1 n=1 Tax=Triticum urartu TaxID=4572 RepID=UPI00204386E2|nr:uncharacterized protein LOC125542293 isoform X1 [Triticum urartu]XP_048561219.1 uncharacterized protein LOC125542294 isoform X1 [Triticum urartu]